MFQVVRAACGWVSAAGRQMATRCIQGFGKSLRVSCFGSSYTCIQNNKCKFKYFVIRKLYCGDGEKRCWVCIDSQEAGLEFVITNDVNMKSPSIQFVSVLFCLTVLCVKICFMFFGSVNPLQVVFIVYVLARGFARIIFFLSGNFCNLISRKIQWILYFSYG